MWLLGNCHQFLYHNSCSFSIFFANFASSLLCLRSHSSNVLFPFSIHTFGVFVLSLALKIIFVLMTHKLYPLPPWTSDVCMPAYLTTSFFRPVSIPNLPNVPQVHFLKFLTFSMPIHTPTASERGYFIFLVTQEKQLGAIWDLSFSHRPRWICLLLMLPLIHAEGLKLSYLLFLHHLDPSHHHSFNYNNHFLFTAFPWILSPLSHTPLLTQTHKWIFEMLSK